MVDQLTDISTKIANFKQKFSDKQYVAVIDLCQSLYQSHKQKEIHLSEGEWFDVLWWLSQSLRIQKQFKQAESIYQELIKDFPKRHHGYQGMAENNINQRNWIQAINWGGITTNKS